MVEPDRVRRLLQSLRQYRDALRPLASLERASYVGSHAYEGRYLVQSSAQVCIDLASHLISSEGWEAPEDFRGAFTVLEHHGVLDASLASRMRAMAGLRNRLVHVYGDIDDGRIHSFLGSGLEDLDSFARAVAALVPAD